MPKALFLFIGVALCACVFDPTYTPPPRQIICTDDSAIDGNVGGCKILAGQGSAEAAAHLGDYYDRRNDTVHAYEWYRKATDRGDLPTLRRLYDDYRVGNKVPRNEGLSTELLNKAAALKAEWALLVLAKQNEHTDPEGALGTYLALARNNNCFAQARLALAYFHGDIAPRNITQSYFWGLLATAGIGNRNSEYHIQTDLFAHIAPSVQVERAIFTCADVKSIAPKMEAEASLSQDRRQIAQDAATNWTPGMVEPQLSQPDGTPAIAASFSPPPIALPAIPQSAHPPPVPDSLRGFPAPDTIAIIIGIDGYENAPRAAFAERDAAAFRGFAVADMGIAESNIKTLLGRGARRLDLERLLSNWVPGHIKAGQTSVLLYFAGHGLASDDGADLYLLPYDGDREVLGESSIRRDRLIERLKSAGAKHITLILDTCYSGLSRDGEALAADSRPIAIVPKQPKTDANVTLLSAAQGTQLSLSLKDAGHGLYSYMLMKGLEGAADSNGDHKITAAELHDYALERVSQEATLLGRKQTPALDGDGSEILVRW